MTIVEVSALLDRLGIPHAQLLDAVPGLQAEVSSALTVLPTECKALWRRILADRPSS